MKVMTQDEKWFYMFHKTNINMSVNNSHHTFSFYQDHLIHHTLLLFLQIDSINHDESLHLPELLVKDSYQDDIAKLIYGKTVWFLFHLHSSKPLTKNNSLYHHITVNITVIVRPWMNWTSPWFLWFRFLMSWRFLWSLFWWLKRRFKSWFEWLLIWFKRRRTFFS